MYVLDFIDDPQWFDAERMKDLFNWATSPQVESSGEGRRQLGYYDGYHGEKSGSNNGDYLRGYHQGVAMKSANVSEE